MSNTTSNETDYPDTPQEVFNLLPATVRKAIYVIVVLVGAGTTVYTVVAAKMGVTAPSWYDAALAGWVTLTTIFGVVAAGNTSKQVASTPHTPETTAIAAATNDVLATIAASIPEDTLPAATPVAESASLQPAAIDPSTDTATSPAVEA